MGFCGYDFLNILYSLVAIAGCFLTFLLYCFCCVFLFLGFFVCCVVCMGVYVCGFGFFGLILHCFSGCVCCECGWLCVVYSRKN